MFEQIKKIRHILDPEKVIHSSHRCDLSPDAILAFSLGERMRNTAQDANKALAEHAYNAFKLEWDKGTTTNDSSK
jgi:hypothetical protein